MLFEENTLTIIVTFYLKNKRSREISIDLGAKSAFLLGNNPEKVDVGLCDVSISRFHGQLYCGGDGQLYYVDTESTNGSFFKGKKINSGVPLSLQPGDRVVLASEEIAYFIVEGQEGGGGMSGGNALGSAHAPISNLLERKGELLVGRDEACDVVLRDKSVSRQHARIRKTSAGKVVVEDLYSTNGTFLNGRRITQAKEWKASDILILGRTQLRMDGQVEALAGKIAIRTESIKKVFPNGYVGLHTTTINLAAGKLLAIMGPSGSGKSTLLKCLTGESPSSHGKVFLQELELVQNYELLKTLIGYVPQDDIVHKELTVQQSLYFAAKLRMENDSKEAILGKIDQVLGRLGILGIRNSPIGKISGGQRKRVSIAVELLTDPLILFLDEPTSPLDPQTIEEFMEILRDLARNGTTVVLVTHKPEDLAYMDEVIFIAEGGYLTYKGPANAYKSYFGVETAVQVYASISGKRSKPWIAKFNAEHPKQPPVSASPSAIKPKNHSYLGQLMWLSRRYLAIKFNDIGNVAIMLGQAPVIALLVLFIFDGVVQAVPFLVTLSAIWFGTSNAAREIVGEAAIYRRERMFNLQISTYILSKVLVLSFFALLQAMLFSGIIYLGFQNTEPAWQSFGQTAMWVWMLSICGTVLGLMLSALVNTSEKVMTLVPLVLIPQVMLAGVVAPISNIAVELISYLAPTRWGNEGLSLIQGELSVTEPAASGEGMVNVARPAEDLLRNQFHESYGDTLFAAQAYTLGLDAMALLGLASVMFVVLFLSMKRKDAI